jgi:putative transcriptional regulator
MTIAKITTKPSQLRAAILETAGGMHRAGIMSVDTFRKITVRQLGPDAPPTAEPISGEEIRTVRERAHLSQAALARYLNLTAGYVSQLERGSKRATGPALALLNVIRRKGIETLL